MTDETKFNSDKADPQLNVRELDNLFNVDRTPKAEVPTVTDDPDTQLQEISDMRKEIQTLAKNAKPDPDSILHNNIERANRLLDKAEEDCQNGVNNRLLEVMAGLINAITTASSSIMGESYNQQVLEHKTRELELKERNAIIKQSIKGDTGTPQTVTQNNLIISSREDLLKMIDETVEDAEVETVEDQP